MTLISLDASSEALSRRRASQAFAENAPISVPRRVVQYWDRQPPEQISTLLERNRFLCTQSNTEYILFNDEAARRFIEERGTERHLLAYDLASHPAMKCDVFRLCYLAYEGGVYVDADIVLRTNIADLMSLPGDSVVFQWDNGKLRNLCNWLISSAPGSPAMLAALTATAESVCQACVVDPKQALVNILNVSGPGIFTRAVGSYIAAAVADEGASSLNVQTVSHAHRLIELGPAYLSAPLGYKNDRGDGRHWNAAAQISSENSVSDFQKSAATTAPAPETLGGLGQRMVKWLGMGKRVELPSAEERPTALSIAEVAPATSPTPQVSLTYPGLKDNGKENRIEIGAGVVGPASIVINGNNNLVRIGARTRVPNLKIDIRGDGCEVVIGERCVLAGEFTCRDRQTRLRVGSKSTMMGAKITLHESGLIEIGEDCMFAGEVRMDTSDMHSIIDASTGQRLNPPGDIHIGEHVWIGFGCYVLKGIRIGEHSVVGACAVVAQDLPPNSLAVGVPAKVIRSGVSWHRDRLPFSTQ
ncbi:glycosyltransferase [Ideonella sp.]|uniref:glycosyltransferase n=1 Tax=Ideonella sp. TaxID=1929293 RepID=UPI003BB5DABF